MAPESRRTESAPASGGYFGIQEAARLSGVGVPTLRAWEARFDFPRPDRGAGGHRRYSSADIEALRRVQADRAAGLQLAEAIRRARTAEPEESGSMLDVLRRVRPELAAQPVTKPALVKLSRAVEDECLQRAHRPVVVAAFQHERYFRRSRTRWSELARAARLTVVCAEPVRGRRATAADGIDFVPLAVGDSLRREWIVAALSADFAACLVGWEAPPEAAVPEPVRRFEMVWSAEPDAVAVAVRHFARLIAGAAPESARRLDRELDRLPAGPPQPGVVSGLTNRMIAYLT